MRDLVAQVLALPPTHIVGEGGFEVTLITAAVGAGYLVKPIHAHVAVCPPPSVLTDCDCLADCACVQDKSRVNGAVCLVRGLHHPAAPSCVPVGAAAHDPAFSAHAGSTCSPRRAVHRPAVGTWSCCA